MVKTLSISQILLSREDWDYKWLGTQNTVASLLSFNKFTQPLSRHQIRHLEHSEDSARAQPSSRIVTLLLLK